METHLMRGQRREERDGASTAMVDMCLKLLPAEIFVVHFNHTWTLSRPQVPDIYLPARLFSLCLGTLPIWVGPQGGKELSPQKTGLGTFAGKRLYLMIKSASSDISASSPGAEDVVLFLGLVSPPWTRFCLSYPLMICTFFQSLTSPWSCYLSATYATLNLFFMSPVRLYLWIFW